MEENGRKKVKFMDINNSEEKSAKNVQVFSNSRKNPFCSWTGKATNVFVAARVIQESQLVNIEENRIFQAVVGNISLVSVGKMFQE